MPPVYTETPVELDLSVAAVLERAARLIETRGLARECYYDGDPARGKLCAVAAVCVAAGLHPDWFARYWRRRHCNLSAAETAAVAAVRALARPLGVPLSALDAMPASWVFGWSDQNTAPAVAAAMRAAAGAAGAAA